MPTRRKNPPDSPWSNLPTNVHGALVDYDRECAKYKTYGIAIRRLFVFIPENERTSDGSNCSMNGGTA